MSLFESVAMNENNPLWEEMIRRPGALYPRKADIRSPFARDYTRILHSLAYRRLKHKTQVFYNIDNDHICTRMEHVAHVDSVSYTIAKDLGLNEELTRAISFGHDLGHAPFGHGGEKILSDLSEKYLGRTFWHEQNGLRFVDNIELLENEHNNLQNLDLTYAVRDGIISHCGEIDGNCLKPRTELIDLKDFKSPGLYQPSTWEGCVVKVADKIAYIGRDIEDALSLGFISEEAKKELMELTEQCDEKSLNTTVIMHNLITDICTNSSPENGICLSDKQLENMNRLKDFNYRNIYLNKRMDPFARYSRLIIDQLFETLLDTYAGIDSIEKIGELSRFYPTLMGSFGEFLAKYSEPKVVEHWLSKGRDFNKIKRSALQEISAAYCNRKIYGRLETKEIYIQSILDFISGMTDRFAIKVYSELLTF